MQRPKNAALRTAGLPETRGAGRLSNFAHRVWAMSFKLGFAGPSGIAYQDSAALSLKDKALLDSLKMGHGF